MNPFGATVVFFSTLLLFLCCSGLDPSKIVEASCTSPQIPCGSTCCTEGTQYCDVNNGLGSCLSCNYNPYCPSGYINDYGQCCASSLWQCPSGSTFDSSKGLCSCGSQQFQCGSSSCCTEGTQYCNVNSGGSSCYNCYDTSVSSCPSSLSTATNNGQYGQYGQCCASSLAQCPSGSTFESSKGLCSCTSTQFQCGSSSCCTEGTQYCNVNGVSSCSSCYGTSVSNCPSGYATTYGFCCASTVSQCPSGTTFDSLTGLCSCTLKTIEGYCAECFTSLECSIRDYCDIYNTNFHSDAFNTCNSCPYPMANGYRYYSTQYPKGSNPGQKSCSGVYWDAPLAITIPIVVLTCAAVAGALAYSINDVLHHKRMLFSLLYLIIVPTFDVVTDMLFLLTTVFFHYGLFVLFMTVLCLFPTVNFVRMLFRLGALPRWRVLEPPASLFPFKAEVRVNDLYKALFDVATLLLKILKLSPWILVNSVVLLPLFFLGLFLYTTRLLSLRRPNNIWFRLWTGTDEFKTTITLSVAEYNEGYYLNVLAESVPCLVLTLINQSCYEHFTPISIASLCLSSLQLLNAVWKFTYQRLYRGMSYKDIALEVPFLGNLVERDGELILLSPDETAQTVDDSAQAADDSRGSMNIMMTLGFVGNPLSLNRTLSVREDGDLSSLAPLLARLDKMQREIERYEDRVDQKIQSIEMTIDTRTGNMQQGMDRIASLVEGLVAASTSAENARGAAAVPAAPHDAASSQSTDCDEGGGGEIAVWTEHGQYTT